MPEGKSLDELSAAAEEQLIAKGFCPYGLPTKRCLLPADPRSAVGYCTDHDRAAGGAR